MSLCRLGNLGSFIVHVSFVAWQQEKINGILGQFDRLIQGKQLPMSE